MLQTLQYLLLLINHFEALFLHDFLFVRKSGHIIHQKMSTALTLTDEKEVDSEEGLK